MSYLTVVQNIEKANTLTKAKLKLKAVGISISKKDDEYRVNYKGGKEATAYYTNDLNDAVQTGMKMAKNK